MKTLYATMILVGLALANTANAQLSVTLNPVQDAYFISFGGGQGCNAMLKFNISSLPPGSTITKATLEVYVYDTTNPAGFSSAVNGNMAFKNLNNQQGWTEGDSAFKFAINNNLYSDSIGVLSGFGDSIGWASSPDIKAIIIKDFGLGNTYCTVFMKDPDDVTFGGAFGPNFSTFLGDQVDSVVLGNKMGGGTDEMIFYPREYSNPNLIPKLTIEYSCSVANSQTLTVCAGGSVMVGTSTYTATGIYSDTLTGMFGCDSIVTTDLTVNAALDLTVTVQGGNVLSSMENGATYQWIDCNNGNQPIGGATAQTFTAPANGDYAVIVTKNNCSDTSVCVNVNTTGISKYNVFVRTYPNPVKDVLTIDAEKGHYEISLSDISGRVLYSGAFTHKTQIDMKHESKGLYLLKISGDSSTKVYKIVKD